MMDPNECVFFYGTYLPSGSCCVVAATASSSVHAAAFDAVSSLVVAFPKPLHRTRLECPPRRRGVLQATPNQKPLTP